MRLVMSEYWPEAWLAIQKTLGESFTKNEMALVEVYRKAAPNEEIDVDAKVAFRVKEALKEPKEPKSSKSS